MDMMTTMGKITIGYGSVLVLLGLTGYFGTGAKSVTALIPAFMGVPIIISGWLSAREKIRMHVMHVAVTLGLLGIIGGAMGLPKLWTMLHGSNVERPAAAVCQTILFVTSLVFVILCVRSFIKARLTPPA